MKMNSGNSTTLRKSGERRCSSRLSKPVFTEAASIATSTEPVPMSRSLTSLPVVLPKRPCMVEKPRWSMVKLGKVWSGSTVYVSCAANPDSGITASANTLKLFFIGKPPLDCYDKNTLKRRGAGLFKSKPHRRGRRQRRGDQREQGLCRARQAPQPHEVREQRHGRQNGETVPR